jgi:hypothetical protein
VVDFHGIITFVDKWKALIVGVVWFIFGGIVINAILNLSENGLPKTILVTGLCIGGIIGIPFFIARIFK